MATINPIYSPYDSERVTHLLSLVSNAYEKGEKQFYEIKVDDFLVVPKTSDPAPFETYQNFIKDNTRSITISMFKGNSTSQDKYFFSMNSNESAPQLGYVAPEATPGSKEWDEKKTKVLKLEFDNAKLIEENTKLKTEVAEKDGQIEELVDLVEAAKQGRLMTGQAVAGGVLNVLLGIPVVKELLAGFGVKGGLSGVAEQEETETEKTNPENQASFSSKEKNASDAVEVGDGLKKVTISDADVRYLKLIGDLHEQLDSFQLKSLMHLLDILTDYPESIPHLIMQTTRYRNQKPKEKNEEGV